jgi:hypothetical protein
MQRSSVHVAIDRDGPDSHFAASPQQTDGNLAAIGDQNLLEHAISPNLGDYFSM